MSVINGALIKNLSLNDGLITPFSERSVFDGVSYGVSINTYDVRIEFDRDGLRESHVIMPGEFLLASTIERFQMPQYLVAVVHDKSTWIRRGLAVHNTVIDSGWQGYLTLELTHRGTEPILLKRGVGIAQVMFHEVKGPSIPGYSGKYQNQERGPVAPKLEPST